MSLLNTAGSLALKKKLRLLHGIDTFLVYLPWLGLFFCTLLKFIFPKDFGPVDLTFLVSGCVTAFFTWTYELAVLLFLRKVGTDPFFNWIDWRIYIQMVEMMWLDGIRNRNSVSFFEFALLAFLTALTPYRLYQFELLRRFYNARAEEKPRIYEIV